MFRSTLFLVLWLIAVPLLAEGPSRTWEGTWNNRKYGTKGPLKCVASEIKPGEWKGKFTGTFQGDPFDYEATFTSKEGRNQQLDLAGKATIRGHRYEWTGVMGGTTLRGKYKSSVGYFGEFVLKESRPKN
jgi:hypothetical protein